LKTKSSTIIGERWLLLFFFCSYHLLTIAGYHHTVPAPKTSKTHNMIPCHDLRTGNYLLVNNLRRKVVTISNSNALPDLSWVGVESTTHGTEDVFPVDAVYPVALSDAILQQCHFVYHDYFKFWQLIKEDPQRSEMNIDRDYNIIDFMRRSVVKNVASLHQLQNIYYLLMGKELMVEKEKAKPAAATISVA
jgi:hypothetical protein